jgi:hypothetical protein
MDENLELGLRSISQQTGYILKRLEGIRDTLAKANESTGYLARFNAIKEEIKAIGWSGVCAKYHPDDNTDDPAAYELFALYRFAYDSMDRSV